MPHHPPHIYIDDTWYFITASTYPKKPVLSPDSHKNIVREQLRDLVAEFKLTLAAWVILGNHYHILIKSHSADQLAHFFGRFHGSTAFELNRCDQMRGRQVWHNYWDTCIRSEKDYWTRFNYIHHNPVKHGYVSLMCKWEFSSYHYYLEHKGEEWLADSFRRYPVVDFTDPRENFIIDSITG
jgi:putative transposase